MAMQKLYCYSIAKEELDSWCVTSQSIASWMFTKRAKVSIYLKQLGFLQIDKGPIWLPGVFCVSIIVSHCFWPFFSFPYFVCVFVSFDIKWDIGFLKNECIKQ